MANIAVYEFEQDPATSEPIHFVSKALAEKLSAYFHHGKRAVEGWQGKALWIRVRVSFRKLKSWVRGEGQSRPHYGTFSGEPYIPEKLPSHKAPGTRAAGPVVEQDGHGRARILIANMIAAQ